MFITNKMYIESNLKNKTWISLPNWGEFLIKLGYQVAQQPNKHERLIVGIAVPTRAYGAALTSLGIVLGRSTSSDKVTVEEHFQSLCNMPKDTPITFQKNAKIYKGILLGCEKLHGEHGIWIKLETSSKEWKPFKDTIYIKKALNEDLDKPLVLRNRQSGKNIRFAHDFIVSLVGQNNLQSFFNGTNFDCAILGYTNILRNEILNTELSILENFKHNVGKLQDILRVRKFMGAGQPYHTNVFRMDGKKPPRRSDTPPYVTIFDGAAGFLKWRDNWRSSHWIAIFDRTEPNFDLAIDLFNQEYIKNHTNNTSLEIDYLPTNCELMAYKEAYQ